MSAAPSARDVRRLPKGASAHLTGRTERGPDRKIRRNSYDVDSRQAQVFRPIGDGTTAGALGWIDCLLKTVTEWDDLERRKGGARPIGFHGIRVLETLLGRRGVIQMDFRTGRLEPAIDTIARVAPVPHHRDARPRPPERAQGPALGPAHPAHAGQPGPQREQVTNAYWFDRAVSRRVSASASATSGIESGCAAKAPSPVTHPRRPARRPSSPPSSALSKRA